jgi:hypothetical protein
MPKKKKLSKDKPLQEFIKAGGRTGAETDFNAILKRAIKPKKASKPNAKTNN